MSKRNISYIKQDEPSFLQEFKKQIGYKEEPNIDSKRALLSHSDGEEEDGDHAEPEDEKPVVVVLKSGDLTSEEAERLQLNQEHEAGSQNTSKGDDSENPPDEKLVFKAPVKRSSGDGVRINASSSSKKKKDSEDDKGQNPTKSSTKQVKNASLLSFDADENEEEDED